MLVSLEFRLTALHLQIRSEFDTYFTYYLYYIADDIDQYINTHIKKSSWKKICWYPSNHQHSLIKFN